MHEHIWMNTRQIILVEETSADAQGALVSRYFEEHLSQKIGVALLPDLRRLTASVTVAIHNAQPWSFKVQDGILCTVLQGCVLSECIFTLDVCTFLDIVAGRMAPQSAFFQRRVEITGDMALGLKMAGVMAQFFQHYPFDPQV